MSKLLSYDDTNKTIREFDLKTAIIYVFNEGSSVLTTGVKGDLEVPFDCEIQRWTLIANEVGSIQIDVWKDIFAYYPPTDADSITGSLPPYISSDCIYRSINLDTYGWTTALSKGEILRFFIDSVVDIKRCTLSLKVTRT